MFSFFLNENVLDVKQNLFVSFLCRFKNKNTESNLEDAVGVAKERFSLKKPSSWWNKFT